MVDSRNVVVCVKDESNILHSCEVVVHSHTDGRNDDRMVDDYDNNYDFVYYSEGAVMMTLPCVVY